MNKIKIFKNQELGFKVRTIVNPDGSISVNAEDTAVGYGWTQTQIKNGKQYTSIRWETLNGYCKDLGFPNLLGKDDYLPESLFYMLGFKAGNDRALKYQQWLAMDVLPSLRKTGSYEMPSSSKKRMTSQEAKEIELKAKSMRAEAVWLNARTRAFKEIKESIPRDQLSGVALKVFDLKGAETLSGEDLGDFLPLIEKTYSATEVGNRLGISSNKVGKLANLHGLKTEEYGVTVMDKSKYSSKEVQSFRYYENVVQKLKEILGSGNSEKR